MPKGLLSERKKVTAREGRSPRDTLSKGLLIVRVVVFVVSDTC